MRPSAQDEAHWRQSRGEISFTVVRCNVVTWHATFSANLLRIEESGRRPTPSGAVVKGCRKGREMRGEESGRDMWRTQPLCRHGTVQDAASVPHMGGVGGTTSIDSYLDVGEVAFPLK